MTTSLRGSIAAAALCALLAACGGSSSTTPPTVLPASVAISNDARADTGATASFKTDLATTDGLTFRWDFGDGTTGSGATVTHAYARTGTYQVTVAVANDAEDLRTATSTIEVGAYANVAGLNCTQADSGGWCWQHALATGHSINDVFFIDATHAWAVGDDLAILKSADAGASWTPVALDASMAPMSLTSVRFYDATHGMALTSQGSALQTSDGGATWSLNLLGNAAYGMNTFIEYGPGRIVLQSSFNGSALASTDGGSTWTAVAEVGLLQSNGTDCWSVTSNEVSRSTGCTASSVASLLPDPSFNGFEGLTAGAFPSTTQGLVIGYAYSSSTYGSSSLAWSTADDGNTWTSFQPAGLPAISYYSGRTLGMGDAQHGVVYSPYDLSAYVTVDGGHNWSALAASSALAQVASAYHATGLAGGSTLWQSAGNHLSTSTDWGLTWTDTIVHDEDGAAASARTASAVMTQYRDANDFVVAIGHRFYVTQDGGSTYVRILGPDSRDAGAPSAAGYFLDARTGKFLTANGALLSTVDGGRTWTRSDFATSSGMPVALQFISATEGYLLLDGELAHSTDGGATWSKPLVASAMAGLLGMSWGDATHAWTWSAYTLYSTADAGAHWTPVVLPNTSGVTSAAMTGPLSGVVSSNYGTLLTTQDGGVSWQVSTSGYGYGYGNLVHTHGQTVWALSNATMRSQDGGQTWQPAGPSNYNATVTAISFADDLDGWMLTSAGNVLRTVDGGDTWSAQVVGTDLSLQAVVAVDARTAWVITRDGQILSTATAGN